MIRRFVLLFLGLLCYRTAIACSTSEGYLRPSNYELVKDADAIVLAVASDTSSVFAGHARTMASDSTIEIFRPTIRFDVITILKGPSGIRSVSAGGIPDTMERYDYEQIQWARGPVRGGPCNADGFMLGRKYVLFLHHGNDGAWYVSGPPFTRIAEPVIDTNSVWFKVVKEYVRICMLNDYEKEKQALLELQGLAKEGRNRRSFPMVLVEDIDRHFSRPYPTKSYRDLMQILHGESNERDTASVLWAFAQGHHPEAATLVRDMVRTRSWSRYGSAISEYLEAVPDTSLVSLIIDDYIRTRERDGYSGTMAAILRNIASDGQRDMMLKALRAAGGNEGAMLGEWFVERNDTSALPILRSFLDDDREFGYHLIWTLAALGDHEAFEWGRARARDTSDDRWMGFYTIARSPRPEAVSLAFDIARSSDFKGIASMIQGYEDSRVPERWAILRFLAERNDLERDAAYWLYTTLDDLKREGHSEAEEILQHVSLPDRE